MNSIELNKNINSIIEPDIKCFVRKNKESGVSKVGIEYYSLQIRTGMVGGVEEGMLDIGRTLYQKGVRKSFIQIFNEDEKLICNQEFKIQIEGQPADQIKKKPDFIMDIVPDKDATKTGFIFCINKQEKFNYPTTGAVLTSSYGKPIDQVPKSVLIKLCFGIIEEHRLTQSHIKNFHIQVHIHQVDFKNKIWNIIVDPFEVTKK